MHSYDNIHFLVQGFSKLTFAKYNPTSPLSFNNYTNWEMHTIWNNPGLLSKTTFYTDWGDGNGYEVYIRFSPSYE